MNVRKGFVRGEQGQTLVETALSIALLLTMIFGAMIGGYMLYTYHYLSYAARLGDRYAMVRGSACDGTNGMPDCPNVTSDQVSTYVKTYSAVGIDPSLLTVTVTWPNDTDDPGNPVKVTASYPFPLSIPFLKASTVNMHSTSQMIISQ